MLAGAGDGDGALDGAVRPLYTCAAHSASIDRDTHPVRVALKPGYYPRCDALCHLLPREMPQFMLVYKHPSITHKSYPVSFSDGSTRELAIEASDSCPQMYPVAWRRPKRSYRLYISDLESASNIG